MEDPDLYHMSAIREHIRNCAITRPESVSSSQQLKYADQIREYQKWKISQNLKREINSQQGSRSPVTGFLK